VFLYYKQKKMAMKLILEITDSEGNISKIPYLKGGLKKIANDYPEIEYHQFRAIYLKCNNVENRKMHKGNLKLMEKFKVFDYI
jgi:hypothetical protein